MVSIIEELLTLSFILPLIFLLRIGNFIIFAHGNSIGGDSPASFITFRGSSGGSGLLFFFFQTKASGVLTPFKIASNGYRTCK